MTSIAPFYPKNRKKWEEPRKLKNVHVNDDVSDIFISTLTVSVGLGVRGWSSVKFEFPTNIFPNRQLLDSGTKIPPIDSLLYCSGECRPKEP